MNFFVILRYKVPKNLILFLIFILSLLIPTSCSKKTEKLDITIIQVFILLSNLQNGLFLRQILID